MSAQFAENLVVAPPTAMDGPVIVIGTGPVGIRVAQEMLQCNPGRLLTLFGDEPWQPYNRVQLSALLAGEMSWGALQNPLRTDSSSRVLQHHNCAVVSIDRERKEVIDRVGRVHPYEKLILAVGSRPHLPSIPGISQEGVFRFRDMSDMQALAARNARSRRAVVLGGGLLGLEAARGLSRAGTEVTVIEHAPRIMPAQLDAAASAMLLEHFKALNINVILGDSILKVLGNGRLSGIRLRDAGTLDCDTLVIATGIRPNIDLARSCGLRVNRGIVIDDVCATSDPNIFAVGECAEHRGQVYGLVGPGIEQAAVLAHHLNGEEVRYTGSLTATRLKVVKHSVFSMGVIAEHDDPLWLRAQVYQDSAAGIYRKLIVRRGHLVGVIALGEWDELNRVQEALHSGRLLLPWQLRRFTTEGRLWPEEAELGVQDWPAKAVVCNCTGVTRGQLSAAMERGCQTVEKLMQDTGASTVCGSCRPLLADLTGAKAQPADLTGMRGLALTALIAVPILLALALPANVFYTDSVQSALYQLSRLWRDGLWKQVSGFSLLGLGVLGLVLTLRKRIDKIQWGRFGYWRFVHTLTGTLALLVLFLHTGLQFGSGLNAWLLTDYLLLALAGIGAALATAYAAPRSSRAARQLQRWANRAHLYIAWPLPVLLGFHVLSVYYF